MGFAPFRPLSHLFVATSVMIAGVSATARADEDVARALNQMMPQVSGENKAWTGLFDAYLDLTPCPREIGPDFDQIDVWPGMDDWAAIEDWASSNQSLAAALKEASGKTIMGLPYGRDSVDARYRDAGLFARVDIEDGGEVKIDFPYMNAFRTFSTWSAAEMYRRFEAGEWKEGFDAMIDNARVLRQLCDRQMLSEKSQAMLMLAEAMSVMRDGLWSYVGKISTEELRRISTEELPFLRVSDAEKLERLELPEGDRIVVEAILDEVFGGSSTPDPQRLGEVFGVIQSGVSPLTRFGATKRWEKIAEYHGSLEASRDKLVDVYDDWWRRWRIRPYDPIQEVPTEFSRLNEVRYAIIAESVADLEDLFDLRLRLIVEINGTIMAAGLCGYRTDRGVWPRDREQAYVTYIPKRFDFDPFDKIYGRFLFEYLGDDREAVDTDYGRLYVENCVVYARGRDHEDSGFKEATLDGITGDMIVWPPLRALAREQGLID
ncbi:MAG: hypothetical protein CMJ34_09875 [Phycisphaerae bacterium]|nr:hypothetical protein [Phycisphaerae bacterium]